MAYKVILGWFKKLRSGNSVSANQSSVAIGRDNYAPINIIHGVASEEVVDINSLLARKSQRQLEYEKHSGKYIPDIFIETRETKNLARTFAHPTLFF